MPDLDDLTASAAPTAIAAASHGDDVLHRAYSVPAAQKFAGIGRNGLYLAMNPDPEKRGGLPFLPSFRVGGRRLIRGRALVAWLDELEARTGTGERGAA